MGNKAYKVCICGGGSLGHIISGVLASKQEFQVNILTRNPQKWDSTIQVNDLDGNIYSGDINVSANPEIVSGCDLILFTLPANYIYDTLTSIKPYLSPETVVGSVVSSTGFFFMAADVLGDDARLFSFQRVPYTGRYVNYGSTAMLRGYKQSLNLAVKNIENREELRRLAENMFNTPVELLDNYLEACFTNSNPLLHPARAYAMWAGWDGQTPYPRHTMFYVDWDDLSSEIWIGLDEEFFRVIGKIGLTNKNIPTILDYYECADKYALTKKMRSIPAFQNSKAPMKPVEDGYVPDFDNRYFTEDIPYGLGQVKQLADLFGVDAPLTSKVYQWGYDNLKDEFKETKITINPKMFAK